MYMPFNIGNDELRKLYVQKGYTVARIARDYHTSESKVYGALHKYGISTNVPYLCNDL